MSARLRWRIAQVLELIWWKRYLWSKDRSEYYAWKKAYWNHFLDRYQIRIAAGARILDAGCGPAGIFIVLDPYEVHALDPLVERYERQLPHFQKKDWPHVNFLPIPLESLQTPPFYDLIFCLNAINHTDQIEKAVQNLSAAAAPGARMYLSVDAHRFSWIKAVLQLFPFDILHPHQRMVSDYIALLEKNGFLLLDQHTVRRGWIFHYYLLCASKTAQTHTS